MMPRCSGPEFRRRQLEDPLIADVPIIVLSAIADPIAEDLHPFARVAKPFDPDQLVRVVGSACQASQPALQPSVMINVFRHAARP